MVPFVLAERFHIITRSSGGSFLKLVKSFAAMGAVEDSMGNIEIVLPSDPAVIRAPTISVEFEPVEKAFDCCSLLVVSVA